MTLALPIVTVTFSPGMHLQALLDSIPAATSESTRVIMADNGSLDGAPEAAERKGYAELLRTGGNLGYGTAINRAVTAIAQQPHKYRQDFVVIVNPDVEFSAGSIDHLLAAAERHPQGGAFGPLIREDDGSVYPSARNIPLLLPGIGHALFSRIWPTNPWTAAYMRSEDVSERTAGWLSGACLLVRRDAFDRIGGFDEGYFMYMEDVDLGDRLGQAGWENVFVPSAEIRHDLGHSAGDFPELMLPAHHESAYKFQSDRYNQPWHWPLRLMLKTGLAIRSRWVVLNSAART